MAADAHLAREFYATQRGVVAGRLVRDRLRAMWPSLDGMGVLGVGFAAPYVRVWSGSARRCVVAVPTQRGTHFGAPTGALRWPTVSGNLVCASEEDALPFADLSFDRVLLVHGLEGAENARAMLREVWRVLKDDGKLIVVAPNRRGLWAHVESTPFGHGQPYSPGQIGRLLAGCMFRVKRRDGALFLPPMRLRLMLRSAAAWEASGRFMAPHLAGVTITEAVKDVYAAIPVKRALRRMVFAEAA